MVAFAPWPQAGLRRAARPVAGVDDAVLAIWREMRAAMYETRGIVGLAAPQLGHPVRLAVLDCSQSRTEPLRLANPEIVWVSAETAVHEEGSPHLPGLSASVARPAEVRVRFMNETGATMECQFDGLWAVSAQHQIDHLDGRMFFDRLSRLKRDRLLAKHAKQRRRAG